jgi:Zn-dependent M28 family amino/carboxypeptidase
MRPLQWFVRRFVRSATVALLLLPVAVSAQAVQRGATTPARARELLSALAHDSLQGRATGEIGSVKAAGVISRVMQSLGLEPACTAASAACGGNDGFYQRVPAGVVQATGRNGQTTQRLAPLATYAAMDSLPAAQRRQVMNVIGILPGSDPALSREYVLVDAHYDHIGIRRAATPGGDSINNGADDDASGVVAVLEIARQLSQGPAPKRTIVFAAMTGEEIGLVGTEWYVAHPIIPLERMAANLEIEMIGRPDPLAGGPGKGWLTGYERSTMGDALAATGIPLVKDPRPQQQFFERSDNIAFARVGIPAHTLSSFNLHTDYHQVSDDVDKVDFDHMAAIINAAVSATRLLADGPKPAWKPGMRPCRRGEQAAPGVCG